MHMLTTSSASLDDLVEPVDLQADAGGYRGAVLHRQRSGRHRGRLEGRGRAACRRCGSRRLRDLRHPMSVDLWIDSVAAHAKVILVRILGGYDWWRYGCDQLAAIARAKGIKLALLPGECRDEDLRLIECSTLPRAELDALLGYFREGGPENMTRAGAAAGGAGRA